jgi:hypothetical protein
MNIVTIGFHSFVRGIKDSFYHKHEDKMGLSFFRAPPGEIIS